MAKTYTTGKGILYIITPAPKQPLPPCKKCGKPTANFKSGICEECKKGGR